MSNLANRFRKSSKLSSTNILTNSQIFNDIDVTPTSVPIINFVLAGDLIAGGVPSGLTQFAGPSRHFKTNLALLCVSAYLERYPEAVCLFYDSEFGAKRSYFESFDIDMDRVVHTPIRNIEELKFDLAGQLESIEANENEKVIIFVDSIGNLPSKKEVKDAMNENSAADMTRAKELKSLFRIITPYFGMKNIPGIIINHSYETIEMYSKTMVSGGTGSYYSTDNIILIGREQEKEEKTLVGYNFVLNAEKSRYIREKSKFRLNVTFENGINKYSGLFDLALDLGVITVPSQGWYSHPFFGDQKIRKSAIEENDEFWNHVLYNDKTLNNLAKQKYMLSMGNENTPVNE